MHTLRIEKVRSGIKLFRRFGELYPGMTRVVAGKAAIVPYRIAHELKIDPPHIVPYSILNGNKLLPYEATVRMGHILLNHIEELQGEIAKLKGQIEAQGGGNAGSH